MPEVPIKIYVERLLKAAREAAKPLGLLSGPVKERALRAMADRLAQDEKHILAANELDVDAVGKSFEAEPDKERVREAVARVRMTSDDVKEMADRLRLVADLPDPVGEVTRRWEEPNGMQVSRVRVPIGVIGVISETKPLVSVESAALCLKSGNVCVLRTAPEWLKTHRALFTGLREAAENAGIPKGTLAFIERPEKEAALELMRAGKLLDAIIPRGGAGLRKAMLEQAKMPVLVQEGGLSHIYIDAEADIPLAQNVVINSKVQQASAVNSVDTLLVQQSIARPLLPALILRLLNESKVEVLGCPKTVALMGQMSMTGHKSVKPATEADWDRQFLGPTITVKMVTGLEEALAHIVQHGPCLTAAIVTKSYEAAMRFTREVDAGAVLVNASTRLNAGDGLGFGADIGLSLSRIHAKGPIGLPQLTCEKYVIFGTGQLRLPHPVPETYFDAIMLKRP